MLDLKFIRKQGDAVRNGIAKKKFNCYCFAFLPSTALSSKLTAAAAYLPNGTTPKNSARKIKNRSKKKI
jgi:hypothetical protein